MVIKVSFQNHRNAKDPDLPVELTKFFEVDALPERARIIGKLRETGCNFDEATLSIELHDDDAAEMRGSGIVVPRIYPDAV